MSNALNASKSEMNRTNKPLVVSCDYNTKQRKLTFYSARECSCDELRVKVKESFKLTTRPFKMRWDDDCGGQNFIQDEATLDEAIEYYQSADENFVTIFVKISLEYNGRHHSPDASRLVGREVHFVEGYQDTFAHADFSESSPLLDTGVQDTGNSTPNTFPSNPPAHTHSPDTYVASSTDDGATDMGIGDSSTDAGSSYNTPHSQHFVQAWVGITRQQAPGRDPMLDELDGQSLSSLSLSGTDPSVPDGGPDASIPPGNRARRDNYSSSRSSGPLEYEAPMHGSRSNYDIGIADDSPQEFTSCSECECILDSIKYTCTTCGGKTPMTRAALLVAAEAKGKGRDRAASTGTSPTRTILAGRGHSSSVSSSSTARAGYELCSACFEKVAVDHSWAFCVSGSFTTPKELGIARRSQPKKKGLLRHVFVEKFWDFHCWTDLVQENVSRGCSICKAELSKDRYKCGSGSCDDFMLCRGCFSIVHNVHPTHPFLDMKAQPASETPNHPEISEGITDADSDDDADEIESPLKHVGYQCSYCELGIIGPRFECTECVDINLCSNCDTAGLLPADSGHRSSHTMSKISIPVPRREVSQLTHGQHHRKGSGDSLPTSPGGASSICSINARTVMGENSIHSQTCDSCEKAIIGVRYQCLNCPSKPSSELYNLCSDCEVNSFIVHDPMHTFLKIPRPVDIPGPLESEFPFIPILYRYPAGPAPGSPSVDGFIDLDPKAYLRNLKHSFAICDKHMGKIVGKWYRCAYCPTDLCADCEEIDTHDKTHAFLVFKAPVDKHAFRPFEDAGKDGRPPLLHGNIYNSQHE